MSRRDRLLNAKQFSGPRKCSCELDLSQTAQAGQLRGQITLGKAGSLTLLAGLRPIACVCYCNCLNLDYEVMTSRQHISYKILFGARGLDKFPASRQIEAHNHDDL